MASDPSPQPPQPQVHPRGEHAGLETLKSAVPVGWKGIVYLFSLYFQVIRATSFAVVSNGVDEKYPL